MITKSRKVRESQRSPSAPNTPASRILRTAGVAFTVHLYKFQARGGAPRAAAQLGLPLAQVVKTLVFEDEAQRGLIVLQHGDRECSTQALARHLGVKRVTPATPKAVTHLTGYQVGGTSPFGMRKPLATYVEASVLELEQIYINGGKRGFLMGIDPKTLTQLLLAKPIRIATGIATP